MDNAKQPVTFAVGLVLGLLWWYVTDLFGVMLGGNAPAGPISAPWDMMALALWLVGSVIGVYAISQRHRGFWKGFAGGITIMIFVFFLASITNR